VLAAAGFGAICGSSVATAATITSVALPEMKRHGYSGRLATGTLAAGGTLGILIPPSVPLVIYAILAEQNIAKLFAAAMVPGLIAVTGYILAIGLYVRLFPGHAPADVSDRPRVTWRMVMSVAPIAVVFVIVFGGIYGGLFTPTEGAGVGAAATFVAALLKRELTWAKVKDCFYATAAASAMIFLIFIGADLMNSALALTQVPGMLAEMINSLGLTPLMVVTVILLFYVVSGAFMDELSVIMLTVPIFFPVIMSMDFGLSAESTAIWFGIMILMTVGFGLLSPPVGLNVYIVNGMAKDVPIKESYKGVLPFLASDVVRTTLLLLFPSLSLWFVQFVQ
ncbi:MAG: TRAP transporter large permease, partial [Hydrogenophaga sp.]